MRTGGSRRFGLGFCRLLSKSTRISCNTVNILTSVPVTPASYYMVAATNNSEHWSSVIEQSVKTTTNKQIPVLSHRRKESVHRNRRATAWLQPSNNQQHINNRANNSSSFLSSMYTQTTTLRPQRLTGNQLTFHANSNRFEDTVNHC